MKHKALVIILLIPVILLGQDLKKNEDTGEYIKTSVVNVPGLLKSEIYQKTHEWIALNYKSADAVIQYLD